MWWILLIFFIWAQLGITAFLLLEKQNKRIKKLHVTLGLITEGIFMGTILGPLLFIGLIYRKWGEKTLFKF